MKTHPTSLTLFARIAARSETFNSVLEKMMPFLPPVGVLAGFLFSSSLAGSKPAIPWLFALMTLSGSLKLRARRLGQALSSPAPVLAFFFGSHVLMPVLAFGAASWAFPGSPDIVAGYVLLFSTPTAVSGFIWVSMFIGDGALALGVILLDSLLAPIIVPFTVSLLLGTRVVMDSGGMIGSLAAMVVAPTILGVALNEMSEGKLPARIGPFLGPVSKLCLVFVIAGNAAVVAPSVDFSSSLVLIVIALCIFLAVVGFSLGSVLGALPGFSTATKRSLTFNIGFRNTNAATTIAIAFFPEAAALPATLGVIFQQSLAAIMGRVLLGPPGVPPAEKARPKADSIL